MNRASLGIICDHMHVCTHSVHLQGSSRKQTCMHAYTHTHTLTKITEDTDSDLGEPICVFWPSGDGPSVGHHSWNPTEVPVGNIHVPVASIFHNLKWLFSHCNVHLKKEVSEALLWGHEDEPSLPLCSPSRPPGHCPLPGASLRRPAQGPAHQARPGRQLWAPRGLCSRRAQREPSTLRKGGGRRTAPESRRLCPREARVPGGPTQGWAVAASEGPGPPPFSLLKPTLLSRACGESSFLPARPPPSPHSLEGQRWNFWHPVLIRRQWWQRPLQ